MVPTATIQSRSDLGSSLAIRVRRTEGSWSCQPGQFYLLRTDAAWSPYLRRALFPSFIDSTELGFLLAPSEDPGLAWLAAQPVGTALDLIGPQGRGFVLHEHQRRVLLAADDASVAALLALISPALARQASITLLLHAHRRADLPICCRRPRCRPRLSTTRPATIRCPVSPPRWTTRWSER